MKPMAGRVPPDVLSGVDEHPKEFPQSSDFYSPDSVDNAAALMEVQEKASLQRFRSLLWVRGRHTCSRPR